jgi:hypothetical protein
MRFETIKKNHPERLDQHQAYTSIRDAEEFLSGI